MQIRSLAVCLVLSVILQALVGCSNFDREWRDAGRQAPEGISGRWQGEWKSESDGHTGALLCVIRQTSPATYDASFNATYAGIFHFTTDAKLTGTREGDIIHLSGEHDLGWPVGVFHYDGAATPDQFFTTYSAKADHGYFALARPGGTPPTTRPVAP
ncbi:MAG TPA: hypothetical protein VLJ39_09470 [Tepidisphaeraceae bacterium]|jgi:hypothetical protein|nr:hypothetical protein [Tepidisphaeraceae bacterium]